VTAVSSLMDRLLDLSKIAYSTEIQCVRQRFEKRERERAQSKMTNNTGFNVTIQKFYNYVF
jgi:hypothetical protein